MLHITSWFKLPRPSLSAATMRLCPIGHWLHQWLIWLLQIYPRIIRFNYFFSPIIFLFWGEKTFFMGNCFYLAKLHLPGMTLALIVFQWPDRQTHSHTHAQLYYKYVKYLFNLSPCLFVCLFECFFYFIFGTDKARKIIAVAKSVLPIKSFGKKQN